MIRGALAMRALAAALVAGPSAAGDLRRTGMCEASAAAVLADGRLAVASDEMDRLAVYDRAGTVPDWSGDLGKVDDIEGAARIGDTVFWITSHGLTKRGKDKDRRRKLLATRMGAGGLPEEIGRKFRDVRGIVTGAIAGLVGGDVRASLDIEGLAATPDGALLIALRAPLTPEGHALLVRVPEPFALLNLDQPPSGGGGIAALTLDLGGRGIRGIDRDAAGTYVVIAGPSGDGDESFALYTWAGTGVPQPVPGADLSGMTAEAVVIWEPGLAEVLGDNGRACGANRWFPSRAVRY